MIAALPAGARPRLQRHWDVRAAGNFIGGGTGTGLVIGAAAAAAAGQEYVPALLVGLASIGAGLAMVMLEIGRPWRAFNVFFHPQTSWMTRESVLALPLFASGGAALLLRGTGGPAVAATAATVAAGLSAGAFLYCQARILSAAKGIPAWREPALIPFVMTSGLAEGGGLLAVIAALGHAPGWAAAAALGAATARVVAWQRYRERLRRAGAPEASLIALGRIGPLFLGAGHGLAALLLLAWMALPSLASLAMAGGLLLAATGWLAKVTIITRAAATRGLAVPRTPVRGRGASRAVAKVGWEVGQR